MWSGLKVTAMTDHLRNLIGEHDGGEPDSAVNTAPVAASPAAPPALSSVIEAEASPQAPAVSEPPLTPVVPDSAAFNLRQNLETRLGIAADSYEDDGAAFEDFATALGQASEVLNSEDFQNYQSQQEEFQAYRAQQSATPDTPATPAPVAPESQVSPANPFSSAKISEDAQLLAQQNLITRGEDGTWTPKQPAFQAFADEYNRHDVTVRTNVMKFSQDPTGFVQNILTQQGQQPVAEDASIKAMQGELAAMRQQLADQASQKSENTIDDWRKTAPLRDEAGALTPYAKEYMRWEKRVRGDGPTLNAIQVHKKVIDSLDFAGVTPEAIAATVESKKPAVPRESMVSQVKKRAATNSNGNGHNRLMEYAASAPASNPGVPTGKAGLPSLHGVIAQTESSLTD